MDAYVFVNEAGDGSASAGVAGLYGRRWQNHR
ncbi:MAG: hypothetical protein JWO18_3061, partial [Microbacteriaceae bacterium]|nr:hypothetical protein [Microbacteriaceae bacterium]